MKKKALFFIICIICVVSFSAFSEEHEISLYIDQILIETDSPVLSVEGEIYIPMVSTFKLLGAQVDEGDITTSYYLNTFVKIDLEKEYYAINGKRTAFDTSRAYRNNRLYVPLKLLQKAFDLTFDQEDDHQVFLKANRIIQYTNYDAIQYKQISIDEDGVRLSIPLDWDILGNALYGFDSSYGRISAAYSSRGLNDNIDTDLIIDTYQEHLFMEYGDHAIITDKKQLIFNYLTSNVLYIDMDVNDIQTKRVVHFIHSGNYVYIMEFNYPIAVSELYLNEVFRNIMTSFYIDDSSFDSKQEHYIETKSARKTKLYISSDIYSNMTVNDKFLFEGYFDTNQLIESLTISVSRKNNTLDFYIPVENNSFSTEIYTPFGLGKHNVEISITQKEEKVIFDPITSEPMQEEVDDKLLFFSVVNLSDKTIRYTIPTKMVQSDDHYLSSMSQFITYQYHTNYSKAKAIYDFITEQIEVLPLNDVNYSALDVYEHYQGTTKEIAFYTTALLRAQNIPAKIIEGISEFNSHIWVEAYLNGDWLIIDPIGDNDYIEILAEDEQTNLPPRFNNRRYLYDDRYYIQRVLDY